MKKQKIKAAVDSPLEFKLDDPSYPLLLFKDENDKYTGEVFDPLLAEKEEYENWLNEIFFNEIVYDFIMHKKNISNPNKRDFVFEDGFDISDCLPMNLVEYIDDFKTHQNVYGITNNE